MTMIGSRNGLATLVNALRMATSTTDGAASAVAKTLRAALPATTLLDPIELAGRPGRRARSVHLHSENAFSIVAIVWRGGQTTSIHDHLAWCVVAVLTGAEHETTYRRSADNTLVAGTETRNGTGSVTALVPPGDIHRVRNLDDDIAVSLHVYGADLGDAGSSVRRVYDVHDGTLDIARIRGVR
jgi:predicted metal-dependent enzyme (double-stranded beta helix superfamily)